MTVITIACARCTRPNHASERYCSCCGLPLGAVLADAGAGSEALGPYEVPDPADPDGARQAREFGRQTGYETSPAGQGWQVVVPLRQDRKQAVYIGPAGTDPEGRPVLGLVSVCGPVNDRDCRTLLKLNARIVEGHFAIRVLRGEEYFVVIQNLAGNLLPSLDARGLIRRIAELADGLEDRLSRGADIY